MGGGLIGPPKMTLKKWVYKTVHFELILPVLHNSFNFEIARPNLWIIENLFYSIIGPSSSFSGYFHFRAPEEGQILIFDKCVLYNF